MRGCLGSLREQNLLDMIVFFLNLLLIFETKNDLKIAWEGSP